MEKLSRRVRAVLVTGAVAGSAAAVVGTAGPASAAPNECNNAGIGVFWHSEKDMADASASWCRDFVLDPGVGNFLTRDQLVAHADLYGAEHFGKQFLWYAPQTSITAGVGAYAGQKWSSCSVFPGGGGACPVDRINTSPAHDITYPFGGAVALTTLSWGSNFIALVCGNFGVPQALAADGQVPAPVPVIRGTKWDDADRDGSRDAGEGPVGGISFRLVSEASLYPDPGQQPGPVATTTSAADGSFSFPLDGLGPGTYRVEEVADPNWVSTTPTSRTVVVDAGVGNRVYDVAFGNRAQHPPVADAGPDRTVDQSEDAGAPVTLDGTGSSDPDGDPLTYTWTGPFGTATGVSPTVTLPVGTSTVTLTVDDGLARDSDTTTVTVYPPITAHGRDVASQEGLPGSGTVATFTDPDPDGRAEEYTATVDWGDGTAPSAGAIAKGADGVFTVDGDHTYTEEGRFPVAVTVADSHNPYDSAHTTSHAEVTDAPLTATGVDILSTNPVVATLATFTDANPNAPLSDFTATIDWGDGSPATAGVVGGATGGPFRVSGTHVYDTLGPERVTVTILDEGGATAVAHSTVLVYALSSGGDFVVGDRDATVGSTVTYWGAQWWRENHLSGGTAPASFKGFQDGEAGVPVLAGWTTTPGNSAKPPASVPSYMAVVVASSVRQQGSSISGDAPHVVIVRTDPGYAGNPGHAGTGTVVAVLR